MCHQNDRTLADGEGEIEDGLYEFDGSGAPSPRRDCCFADPTPPSMLKHLLKAEGGCSRTPVSSQRLGAWSRLADWAEQHCPSSCGRLRSDCYAPGCQAKTHTQPC